jgi:hypothetical protein
LKPQNSPRVSSLEKWLRAIDFTKVQELELGNTQQTFFDRIKRELPRLRKLTMDVSDFPSHTMDFLDSTPLLEALSIRVSSPYRYAESKDRMQFPLSEILSRHESNLHTAELEG